MDQRNYQQTRWVVIAVVVIAVIAFTGVAVFGNPATPVDKLPTATPTPIPTVESKEIKNGKGATVKNGDKIRVHYKGSLTDGTVFESSYDSKSPFEFTVGAGEVIRGWDQGVLGMKAGGKRKLTIPAALAYGETGSPPKIAPNSTLIFEIEVLKIL